MLCRPSGKVSHRARKVNPIAAAAHALYARAMTDRRDTEEAALGGIFARWLAPPAVVSGDPVEVWGTRIGRGLSAVAVIAICLYLVWTYVQ
jgi:hypothetical protein